MDAASSILVTGADSLATVAVWIGMLGIDFHVLEPPELVRHLREIGERYLRAVRSSGTQNAGQGIAGP